MSSLNSFYAICHCVDQSSISLIWGLNCACVTMIIYLRPIFVEHLTMFKPKIFS